MKRFSSVVFAALFVVGGLTASQAHEGHDHGSEPHDQLANETGSPPLPPSDTFIPESRPLQSEPSNNDRTFDFGQPPISRPSRDYRDIEPEPRDFVPPSRPSRSLPPTYGDIPDTIRPSYYGRRDFHYDEPTPYDSAPRSVCPLGRECFGSCPEACEDRGCRCGNTCVSSPACPLGDSPTSYECPWERNQRLGQRFDRFEPPRSSGFGDDRPLCCPSERGDHFHPGTTMPDDTFDRRIKAPLDQPMPFFQKELPRRPSTFSPETSDRQHRTGW